ncbi:YicC family protein [candidate division WOR-3 bacterium]|nr:YicC family protein [candidate division WOR-3 bacterium]
MIRSMTGVGRAEAVLRPWDSRIVVDIRSVNHKFFELNTRLPSQLAGFESEIRSLVSRAIPRGYVQLQVALEDAAESARLVVDHHLVRDYLRLARELAVKYRVGGELTLPALLSQPGVVTTRQTDPTHLKLWQRSRPVVVQALRRLIQMKRLEGATLVRDMRRRVVRMKQAVRHIEGRVPRRLRERRENLLAQLRELKVDADPKRILEEVAFIADRVDIHEECIRLKSHCGMYLRALRGSAASGKKLDFIAQEMLRETDTLSAKARDVIISRRAIEIKGEIEKLKEQVRNVE